MSGKDKYYWSQLRGALTAGQWSSQFPAKAPNGTALSWSELFRKFNKHCPGFRDITEVASQTHALALLLAADAQNEDQDVLLEPGVYALELGDECILPEERKEEAQTGYKVLQNIKASNFDTLNFALAYYAYALGNPTDCLEQLAKVPELSHVQNHIPLPGSLRSNEGGLPAIADDGSSTNASVITDATVSIPEIKDGRAWAMTETFRSLCLQGMSHEKLSPSDPALALKSYSSAFPLLRIAETEIGSTPSPTATGRVDFTSFTKFRELWRWVERLLWRAIILASHQYDVHHGQPGKDMSVSNSLWTWLNHYSACSVFWPSNFMTSHRSTISGLYLRALVLRHENTNPLPKGLAPSKPPPWLSTARTVVQEYRSILSVSTKFPKAGQRNIKVEEFVDLCVAVWEAAGAVGSYTSWVIDVLWWATRMTFNSYRIMRHMTRLLHVSGDTSLAKRTLRLYVQLVDKAWQATGAGVGEVDADKDRDWVETLMFGVRMFCKLASAYPGGDGIEDVREAENLIHKARLRLNQDDKDLVASVDLSEGIVQHMLAIKEQDPHTRPNRLASAHTLFARSAEVHPTPSAYYHLALSFTRPGPTQDIDAALVNAGHAVEGDSTEIRYWHLLGLISGILENWDAADVALESGAVISESDKFAQHQREDTGNGMLGENLIDGLPQAEDPASFPSPSPPAFVLSENATVMPPVSTLLPAVQASPPPSRQEIFEYALQLRMTQLVLVEHVEGPEGAAEKLPEIFQWIAEQRGTSSESARTSIDVARSAEMKLKSPSELVLPPQNGHEKPDEDTIHEEEEGAKRPIPLTQLQVKEEVAPPITISPATPIESTSKQRLSLDGKPGDRDRDASKSKKMQQMLKNRVSKGGARLSTISRRIGHGVVRNGATLRRATSTPDLHAVLRPRAYQASSIHSRKRISVFMRSHETLTLPMDSPPPPPPPVLPPTGPSSKHNTQTVRESRLLSSLWLMSAATFRRLGKIEQAKGAIQEAEVKDENNPGVWVQLGLYYLAMGESRRQEAVDAFRKALFVGPDDVAAGVGLARVYLELEDDEAGDGDGVDLAAGLLTHLTRGAGWDVPEAWYFLAKVYGKQDRVHRQREALGFALGLAEKRGIREIGGALGEWR